MRRGAILALLLVGCGGGGGLQPIPPTDGGDDADAEPPPDVEVACHPISQIGCVAGEKCTWIIDQDGIDGGDDIAHIGCAPDGAIGIGQACTGATSTANLGIDACEAGAYCQDGVCEEICDLAGHVCDCRGYANVFDTGGMEVAGLCDIPGPDCDPLTQASTLGAAACGSPNPAAPTQGCFSGDLVHFTCDVTSSTLYARTDRVVLTGTVFPNSCAPGYLPLLHESTASMSEICVGLCAPLDTDDTMAQNGKGDPVALGKQPTDPAPTAGHATCRPFADGGKGSLGHEECRYVWTIMYDSSGNPIQTPYRDTLGFCFAYDQYLYDPTGGTSPTTPWPACAALPPRSGATTGTDDDAADWGCYNSVTNGNAFAPAAARALQIPSGGAVLTRHHILGGG